MNRDLKQITKERMSKVQRSSPLSPFFSFILLFHCMVCSPHTVKASQPSPFFDYCPNEKVNNIPRGLPEEILQHLVSYLPQKDAISLCLTSKALQWELKSVFNDDVSRKLTEKDYLWPSDKFSTDNLYINLTEACKLLSPSDQPSPKDTTLLISGHSSIHMEHASVLTNFFGRDKYGVSLPQKDKKDAGNHSTQPLGQVYIKADDYLFNGRTNPLDFMMEKAVSLLSYHLFPQERLIAYSQIATFNNLHKVKIVEEHDTYLSAIPGLVQIAEKVEGIRLDEVLKKVPSQGYDAWYKDHFSLDSYQSFVLLSLLIRPADYKADNIMLKKEKNHKGQEVYHLVGIDNDMAFADSLVDFHGATHVGVKNILYALPLMDEPFTQEVIQGIKGWNPALIVIQWLKDLDHYNQHYTSLFEGRFKERYNTIPLWIRTEGEEPYPARFPLKLREGTAIKLYEDLNHIKKVVEDKEVNKGEQEALTLHQAFQTIDPLLADYYRWLREEYKTILIDQGQGAEQAYKHASGELYKTKKEWKTIEELFTQNNLNQGLKNYFTSSKDSKDYLRKRIQGLNEVLIQHLDTLELQALAPYNRKQVLEEAFLSFPKLIAQAQHPQWHSPYLVHEGLKHKEALFSLSLLKMLINKFPNSLRRLDEEQGYAPLHYAIQNQVDISILEFLIKIGTDVNQGIALKNGRSLTPLDLACIKEDIHAFMLLAHKGATSLQNLKAAASFYTTGLPKAHQLGKIKEWKIVYAYLRQKSDELNWLLALEEHFPQGWTHQEDLPKTYHEIKGAFMGKRVLSPQMATLIFDQQGKFKRDTSLPGRAESTRYPQENPLFYLKKYPEIPAYEYAATSFMRSLGMNHIPRSELLIFHDSQEGPYPVLLTEAISGKLVCEIWGNDDTFKHLDPMHTNLLIIASMLLNPEDQKEDNFILSPDKKYLIPIDNDHVFLPGAIQIKGFWKIYPQLQTKTLAFCLEEMNKPLSSSLVQTLISLNVDQLLQQWMEDLCSLQDDYDMLPSQTQKLWNKKNVTLRLPLSSLYIEGLYRKFHLLQKLLTIEPTIALLDLLSKVEPYIGKHYLQAFSLSTLKARFDAATESLYQSSKAHASPRISVQNSRRLFEIINLSDQELMSQMTSFRSGPEAALEQLIKLQKEHQNPNSLVQQFLREETTERTQLRKEEEQQRIKDFFETNRPYDVLEIPYSSLLKLTYFQTFEFTNKGQYITVADLRGAKYMREEEFMALQQACPNLLYLNISGWNLELIAYITKLKRDLVGWGSVDFQYISHEASFKQLERLVASSCPSLINITLFLPKLKSLEICSNIELGYLKLKAPELRLLDVTGNINFERCTLDVNNNVIFKGIKSQLFEDLNEPSIDLSKKEVNSLEIYYLLNLIQQKKYLFNIKSLELEKNKIGVEGAKAISQSSTLTNLTYLDLGWNSIGNEGIKAISQSSTLVNLSHLNIDGNKIEVEGAKAISQSSFLKNLSSLKLWWNKVGIEGAKAISESPTLSNLIHLGIGKNKIGVEGAKAISQSSTLTNLTHLDIEENNIGDEGAKAISQSSTLTNLTHLGIEENNIGDEGAKAISQSSTLTNLISLDLWNNKIGDEGAIALSQSSSLTNFKSLNLGYNKIGKEVKKAIKKSKYIKYHPNYG